MFFYFPQSQVYRYSAIALEHPIIYLPPPHRHLI